MAAGGSMVEPEEELSSRSSSGCDSEKWETSVDEGRAKSKKKFLPEGFLDPLPPQKSSKLPRLSGDSSLRRAKMISSKGESSRGEGSRISNSSSTPVSPNSEEHEFSCTNQSHQQSFHAGQQAPRLDDGIWLVDDQGAPVRRRGRTKCVDIQNLSPGTRVHIEVNENGVPCNIPESVLLGSYMGVIARNPILAPISFSDWRNKSMEPFKKRMLAKIESKFEFPGHIRHWILQSIGVKWRNYKTSLKSEYWNSRPIEEIMKDIPQGVDATQWCQLVTQWSQPENQARAAKNTENAKKQTCPHTMGRISSVRRQKETTIQDRLQLWRINRIHKDGSWSSEDARQKWIQACEILGAKGLTPEDGNLEANERVFMLVMGPEHPGRVRTRGFGVTPSRYFPQSTTTTGESSSGNNFARVVRLEEDIHSLRAEMREFMQQMRMNFLPPEGLRTRGTNHSSEE